MMMIGPGGAALGSWNQGVRDGATKVGAGADPSFSHR